MTDPEARAMMHPIRRRLALTAWSLAGVAFAWAANLGTREAMPAEELCGRLALCGCGVALTWWVLVSRLRDDRAEGKS